MYTFGGGSWASLDPPLMSVRGYLCCHDRAMLRDVHVNQSRVVIGSTVFSYDANCRSYRQLQFTDRQCLLTVSHPICRSPGHLITWYATGYYPPLGSTRVHSICFPGLYNGKKARMTISCQATCGLAFKLLVRSPVGPQQHFTIPSNKICRRERILIHVQ